MPQLYQAHAVSARCRLTVRRDRDAVQRIIADIGVEALPAGIADGIGLQEPPQHRRVHAARA